ncbi:MAG: glycosyltransferase, partial [Gemmataceae bacterium]
MSAAAEPIVAPLAQAERRIEQLEAALARRTELLTQKQLELAAIRSSKAFRAATLAQKILDRLFPLHTRRRGWLKSTARTLGGVVRRKRAVHGPSPEERHHTETIPESEYRRWISKNEPSAKQLDQQRQTKFGRSPKLSIVVPVYNPPLEYLTALLKSVQEQTYQNWELCLADASTNPATRTILENAARADSRIRATYLTTNEGIVGNTNRALALATGDYVALLDHDDTLASEACFRVVEAINEHPNAELLYSDEDKLNAQGLRVEPNFKPDWSPETLRSRNYICHWTILTRGLI